MVSLSQASLRRALVVCALGYFIDVFDIQLFAVLRVPSLMDLGVPADRLATMGGAILNLQMVGMILGAFLWGWLGDRFGRLKALYGSILVYSLGTLACSFVQEPAIYGLLRCFTGFGLSGETGAAITLVSELMSAKKRGWGVTLIGGIGLLGPVFAILISWVLDWRTTYIAAGVIGLILLILRMRLAEPALFEKLGAGHTRGSIKLLLQPRQLRTLMICLLVGLPTAFLWFLLNFFSAEFSKAVLLPGASFNQKFCLLCFFVGTSFGAFLSGALSQFLESRVRPFRIFLVGSFILCACYLLLGPQFKLSTSAFYFLYLVLGVAAGWWLMITLAGLENFGTNIRATATIVLTNLLRGFTIPMILAFQFLRGSMEITYAAAIIGSVLYIGAFLALTRLRETHGLDLDYVERLEKPLLKT